MKKTIIIAVALASVFAFAGSASAQASYRFARDLSVGSAGADVSALQSVLIGSGHLHVAAPTGYFGAMTRAALASYQASSGIVPSQGYFGQLTRAHFAAQGSVAVAPSVSGCAAGYVYSVTTGKRCDAAEVPPSNDKDNDSKDDKEDKDKDKKKEDKKDDNKGGRTVFSKAGMETDTVGENDSIGKFTFNIDVGAFGQEAFVELSADRGTAEDNTGFNVLILDSGNNVVTDGELSFSVDADEDDESENRVEVGDGKEVKFTVTAFFDPAEAGTYKARLYSVNFNDSNDDADIQQRLSESKYRTASEFINQ